MYLRKRRSIISSACIIANKVINSTVNWCASTSISVIRTYVKGTKLKLSAIRTIHVSPLNYLYYTKLIIILFIYIFIEKIKYKQKNSNYIIYIIIKSLNCISYLNTIKMAFRKKNFSDFKLESYYK